MKKIYLSLLAAAAMTTAGYAQKPSVVSNGNVPASRTMEMNVGSALLNKTAANVPIVDTVDYYFWKQFFKKSTAPYTSFPTYSIVPTSTNVVASSAFGSIFRNTGAQAVFGAEALTMRAPSSPNGTVNVVLEIFNAPAGIPTGAALGSCTTGVSTSTAGVYVGCDFASPVLVNNEYVITLKPSSSNPADGITVFMTSATQPTSAATQNKFGEGNGYIRTSGGTWYSLTGVFTPTAETDFEPVVAARVGYSITADHSASTSQTVCNTAGVNYPNTSSAWLTNRQFNMNRFVKYWAPFTNPQYTVVANAADSIFTWNFGDGSTEYLTSPTHTYISVATSGSINDALIAKHMKMSGSNVKNLDSKSWSIYVNVCNVGLAENSIESKMSVYPNPATDKVVVYLNDVTANTKIEVMNALGQVVLATSNVSDKNELNTESLAKGVYFVKVSNGKESATSKLIINK